MKYSIYNDEYYEKLCLSNDIESSYFYWQLEENKDPSISNLFFNYKLNYSIKNDFQIGEYSYFGLLCDLFSVNNFSINFLSENIYQKLKNLIYHNQLRYYANKGNESDYGKKSIKDSEIINFHLDEILEKNPIILEEFKSFLFGFPEYIKQNNFKDYLKFKSIFNILYEDMKFFKNTHIKSLDKYSFVIGSLSNRNTGDRGSTDDFIPDGSCSYGSKIVINSNQSSFMDGKRWVVRYIKRTLYHEVAHALDHLYNNETIIKGQIKNIYSSSNKNLLKICIKNYRKLRYLYPQLNKDSVALLNYYSQPIITILENKEEILIDSKINEFSLKMQDDFLHIFEDLIPLSVCQDNKEKAIKPKLFSPVITINNKKYDYSRALEETWAESFSIIFDWLKNGFCEYDTFTLKAGKSSERRFIHIHNKSLMFVLKNVDWQKLNISQALYLRRKKQITQHIQYIKNLPLVLGSDSFKMAKKKKYYYFKDILKGA